MEMPLGSYLFNGLCYQCFASGLYLFWDGASGIIHARLVHGGDLYGFLSGVSWHHAHGVADEDLTEQKLANAGMTHKWRLRCGYITDLMLWWLPQYRYKCRKINILTKESLNGVDDGHIAFEVHHQGKWKLWDITNGCYFEKGGIHLSIAEVIAAGVVNCSRVAIDADEKRGSELAGVFDMASYRDLVFRTPDEQNAWFKRIYQSWSTPG